MNGDIKKFEELMTTDEAFQVKLKAALENYSGEQTEKAVFEEVLAPLAKEYGLSATYEEFAAYLKDLAENQLKMGDDELGQIAGGSKEKDYAIGASACCGIGAGVLGPSAFCVGIGFGGKGAGACVGPGTISK